ncbi:hypothetical protein DFH11DRAFT_1884793 [Phellopilus nigrolimitatus]|nr:hypothetical protein DFH11DRAFT_1884793 [Phellopilus nigrolimitatus]
MAGTGDVPVVAPGDMAAGNMAAAGPAAAPVAREMPVNGAIDEIAATGAPDAGAVVNDVSPGAGAGADDSGATFRQEFNQRPKAPTGPAPPFGSPNNFSALAATAAKAGLQFELDLVDRSRQLYVIRFKKVGSEAVLSTVERVHFNDISKEVDRVMRAGLGNLFK